MNKVFREEKKFLLNIEEYIKTSRRLEQVMAQDPHNGPGGYPVRSLYFDTVYDSDFFEKEDGLELRRKVRLRVYDPDADFAMMEIKQKEGSFQMKRSLRVTREDGMRIAAGEYEALLGYGDPFAAECYALMRSRCYRPVTVVEYDRKAFVAKENDIRITFDSNISAAESSLDVFSPKLNTVPVIDRFDVLLEVKYNGFMLDYLRGLLNAVDKSELSVSKYTLARQNAYQTHIF